MQTDLSVLRSVDDLAAEIYRDCIGMAPLRSDFTIDKFTVAVEGPFIAHRFHMLMRQYSLTVSELRRLMISRERKVRQIDRLHRGDERNEDLDLDVAELQNDIFLLDIDIANKQSTVRTYETIRKALINANGDQPITIEQWQAEEPDYWVWFLKRAAVEEFRQVRTGISAGVQRNARYLAEKSLLSKDNEIDLLGQLFAAKDMVRVDAVLADTEKQLGQLPGKDKVE